MLGLLAVIVLLPAFPLGQTSLPVAGITVPVHARLIVRRRVQVDDVVVVLRSTDSALAASLPTRSLQVCMNSQPQRGMGFSLRQGIAASADADGWLVLPVDLPFLRVETIARARSVLRPGRAVVPVYHGRRGHPVALSAYFAPQLLGLDGDAGARRLLDREHDRVHWMNVHDPGIYRDIDQPQDLLSL